MYSPFSLTQTTQGVNTRAVYIILLWLLSLRISNTSLLYRLSGLIIKKCSLASEDIKQKERKKEAVITDIRLHGRSFSRVEKVRNLKPLRFLSCFRPWHVKGFSSKLIALKADAVGPENKKGNIRFAGASVYHSARKCYRLGQ